MAKKKQTKSKADKLLETTTAKLTKTEAKATKWKAEAKRLEAELKAAAKKFKKATKEALTPPEATDAGVLATPATSAAVAPGPDETWTVIELRAAARERGIAGYSRKSKAELLALLQG